MEAWSTYRLEDFLLFAPRTYWRLFELHNAALWPLQVPVLVVAVGLFVLLVRPRPWSGRVAGLVLAAGWLAVAWLFLWQPYAMINWAVVYAVPLFLVEATLLALAGLQPQPGEPRRRTVGIALLVYAILVHPLLAPLTGGSWRAGELVLLTPDPTAIATLGAALLAGSLHLAVVPVLWCLASALTLLAMGSAQAWVLGGSLVLFLVGAWPRAASERA